MMFWSPLICSFSCLLGASSPGDAAVTREPRWAPPPGPQDNAPVQLEDVIVTGRRGAAAVAPETELGAAEIDAFGGYDIGETLARIGESLGFDDPPIIIVNGRRVVNPNDFMGFPPDAMERVEALPRQAAAMYGGDPSRRVLNIVLQPSFRSRDGRAAFARPTAGGRSSGAVDARQSAIENNDTSQFGGRVNRDTPLRGAERPSYVRDHPGHEDATLRPGADVLAVNASATRALGGWAGSINARAQMRREQSTAVVGGDAVETQREAYNLSLGGGVSGEVADWSVRLVVDATTALAKQEGLGEGRFRSFTASANLSANRTLVELPAGPLIANLAGRYSHFESTSDRDGPTASRSIGAFDLGGNLSLPLARSKPLAVTLGATLREVGGTRGTGLTGGLAWSPASSLRFNGLWSRSVEGPNAQQRLDPPLFGEPRVVFDFQTGEAVEVLPLLGGNPDLRPQTTDLISVTASAGPFTSWKLWPTLSFQHLNAADAIGGLPGLTPEVEAAFPERFVRDASGRLVIVDQRPINLEATRVLSLSTGLGFTIPPGSSARPGDSLRIGLSHSLQLENTLVIRDGLLEMDRLAGDGGGVSRHQISVQVDGRQGAWGLNAGARWRSRSRTRRDTGQDGPGDLLLDDLTMLDLKLSYLFARDAPTRRDGIRSRRGGGLKLELEIDNLTDVRPTARLGDGRLAPGYGRYDQDPLGRTIRLTLSRRF